MATKLTPAQIKALRAMPFDLTMWGDKPHCGVPDGVRMPTLWALKRWGLAKTQPTNMPSTMRWSHTLASKAALRNAAGM